MKTRKILNLKKFLATLTAVALIINTAAAQPFTAPTKPLSGEPLSVKYLGSDDNYLLFEVTVTATTSQRPVLTIDDKNAGQLYTETLKNSEVQKIKIEKNDNQSLSFELIEGKKIYSKTFDVQTSLIEKTTVSEEGQIVTRY